MFLDLILLPAPGLHTCKGHLLIIILFTVKCYHVVTCMGEEVHIGAKYPNCVQFPYILILVFSERKELTEFS